MSWIKPRKKEFKDVRKPILIVCEDSKSSVYYLRAKVRSCGLSPDDVKVDGDSDSSPISVVDYAIKEKAKQLKLAKENKIYEYEAVYCVIDVDDHPTLKAALSKARDNKLISIVSNECFELWYLLHFIPYSTKHLSRRELEKQLTTHLGKPYDKGDDKIFYQIKDKESTAINIAKQLDSSALSESSERNPKRNPSTDVYVLIEAINSKKL